MGNAGQTMDYANEPRLVFASKLGSWHLSRMPLARVSRPCSCISMVTPDKPALTHKQGPRARQLLTKDRLSHHYATTHQISFVMRQEKPISYEPRHSYKSQHTCQTLRLPKPHQHGP
jgi:hypothetical protein